MKILIIDNVSIPSKEGKHYTNALNGLFIDELLALGNELSCFQLESFNSNNISSFELEEHGVICTLSPIKKNKLWTNFHPCFQKPS